MIDASGVASIIEQGRFDLGDEKACQAEMANFLAACLPLGVAIVREHRLSGRDIVDFLIDGVIAVEVKMRGVQARAVLRQLARYAAHPRVEAIVLATSRAMDIPAMIGGKPVIVASLGKAWL